MKTLARRRDADEIRHRLSTLAPTRVPQWGRMSAHEMVCHLADGVRMMVGEKPVRRITGAMNGMLMRWIALYAPWRWPTGLRTTSELDQERDGTRPVDFATDCAGLEALLARVASEPAIAHRRLHPLFGTMSGAAWLRWAYLHADHHLRQFGA